MITIVIATYNRPQICTKTVEQLLDQNIKEFRLIVIDQSSKDNSMLLKNNLAQINDKRIEYVYLDRAGLPNARNVGLSMVRDEYVLFLDDDVIILTENLLEAHLNAYSDPTVGGVVGRHVERTMIFNTRKTCCRVGMSGRILVNLFGTERKFVESCKGSNMSFRMAVVPRVGGFDRKTQLLEETDFSTRVRAAGWKILFEPDAELVHLSSPSGGVRMRNRPEDEKRRFSSTAYYILKHRGWIGVVPLFPTFTLVAVIKALKYRSMALFFSLISAMFEGFRLLDGGPDQDLVPR